MPKNLDFSTLIPERDTFTDQGGTNYEFKARADFGAVDLARVTQYQGQIKSLLDTISQHPDNEEAAANLETLASKFIGLILPSLPQERVASMTLGQKTMIVEWWTTQQKAEKQAGEALANQSKS